MNQQIADTICKCNTCDMYRNAQTRGPLKSHEIPGRPWQKVAVDLFEPHDKQDYVVIVDYYSKFFEVPHLPNSRSETVINHIKPNLVWCGIPEIKVSDNGPEFLSSREFEEFAKYYGFKHTTTSPRYPQSNGLVAFTRSYRNKKLKQLITALFFNSSVFAHKNITRCLKVSTENQSFPEKSLLIISRYTLN